VAEKIVIDPITRIEGHLKIETIIEDGVVKDARSTGNLFRGIELILRGRDPRDAQVITQRICGVCPQSHGVAAALNLDSAFGIGGNITENGRIIRNLIQGAHVVQDHILHFYHLAALDYVDVTDVAKYTGNDTELNSIKTFIERGELGRSYRVMRATIDCRWRSTRRRQLIMCRLLKSEESGTKW
jgi:hydrogenase large subunit